MALIAFVIVKDVGFGLLTIVDLKFLIMKFLVEIMHTFQVARIDLVIIMIQDCTLWNKFK